MADLKDKRVVIIGGSSGIGLDIAKLVLAKGAKVHLAGRHSDRLATARVGLEGEFFDVEVKTDCIDAHDFVALENWFSTLDGFDYLVSMVGDVMGGGFIGASIDTIRHVMESKFLTNVRIGQLAAEKITQGGAIIFTSGTGGRAQDACASYVGNLGINALVEGLAVELAPNARVNAVSPTWTLTTFWRDMPTTQVTEIKTHFEQTIPLGRTATVRELASTYVYLMENDFITGQHIAVDGGIMLG